jgi:hypothetical protein
MSESERSRLLPGHTGDSPPAAGTTEPFLTRLGAGLSCLSRFVDTELVGRSLEDDSVSLGVKKVGLAVTVVVCCWLLSFLLVMLQVGLCKGHFIPPYSLPQRATSAFPSV